MRDATESRAQGKDLDTRRPYRTQDEVELFDCAAVGARTICDMVRDKHDPGTPPRGSAHKVREAVAIEGAAVQAVRA
jgi:hypothetical protein